MSDFNLKSDHLVAGCNKFADFPENQMTKFHAEFANFMQNLETREYRKTLNASKTVTEQ